MANEYILDFSTSAQGPKNTEQPAKNQLTLAEKTAYDTLTSIKLFGKGAPNYGEGQQEGILRILENFASETAPSLPTIGQLWWKVPAVPSATSTPMLMVCESSSPIKWIPVNDPLIRVAYNYEYNRMVELYKQIVGAAVIGTGCFDSYGWDQTALAASVSPRYLPAQPVSNVEWVALLAKWAQIAPIVGIDASLFDSDGFIIPDHYHIEETATEAKGIGSIVDEYQRANNATKAIWDNRFGFAASYLDLAIYNVINKSTYFTDETYLTFGFQWVDAAAMHRYFTTGGFIRIIPTIINPVDDPTTNLWVKMLEGFAGGIDIRGCSTNDQRVGSDFSKSVSIFSLPNTFTTLYKANEYDSPVGNYRSIYGSIYGAVGGNAPTGNDTDIGWADLTIDARRDTTTGLIEVRMTYDNETNETVKGLMRVVLQSRCASSTNWNGITPSPAPSHPTLTPAAPVFT